MSPSGRVAMLILHADQIPDGTIVHKPQGGALYELKHKLTVYGLGKAPIFVQEGIYFLVGRSIQAVRADTRLAIDFRSVDSLQEFIDLHMRSHQ